MQFVVLGYAVLILIGGIIGGIKASSYASLISGSLCGILLIGCSIAIFAKKNWGPYAALILTFILDGFFTFRFVKTEAFMPAGMLSLISLAVLIYLAASISRRARS